MPLNVPVKGNCLCGASPFTIKAMAGYPSYVCHCTDCQRRTGSAFAVLMPVPRLWLSLEDSAHPLRRKMPSSTIEYAHHCPQCRTLLFTTNERRPGIAIVRVGTLDDLTTINPKGHIWAASRQPWVAIPETAIVHDGAPPEEAWARMLMV